MNLSISEVARIIPTICAKETSSSPELWTCENPTQGHCAIVSVLAQEQYGGEIVRVSLKDTPYKNLRSHYFNVMSGKEVDFTRDQFEGEIPYYDKERIIVSPDVILSFPGTQERYLLLKSRLV